MSLDFWGLSLDLGGLSLHLWSVFGNGFGLFVHLALLGAGVELVVAVGVVIEGHFGEEFDFPLDLLLLGEFYIQNVHIPFGAGGHFAAASF